MNKLRQLIQRRKDRAADQVKRREVIPVILEEDILEEQGDLAPEITEEQVVEKPKKKRKRKTLKSK